MAACEVCWERAQQDVMLLGGSVADHYEILLLSVDVANMPAWHLEGEDRVARQVSNMKGGK